jgi:hypothetical protein
MAVKSVPTHAAADTHIAIGAFLEIITAIANIASAVVPYPNATADGDPSPTSPGSDRRTAREQCYGWVPEAGCARSLRANGRPRSQCIFRICTPAAADS